MTQLTTRQVAEFAHSGVTAVKARFPKELDGKMWRRVLVSLAKTESNNNPTAKNRSSSARGLMQILKGTQADIERRLGWPQRPNEALDNPAYAMMLAAYYVAWLYMNKAQKSWDRTVVAYNQGHYNTSKAGEAYRQKVFAAYRQTPWEQTSPYA